MATMQEINEARANRMQSGLYGTPRTDAQKQRSYGQMSDVDASQRDAAGREQYRQNLVSQIPGPSPAQLAASGSVSQPPKPSAMSAYSNNTPDTGNVGPAPGMRVSSTASPNIQRIDGAPGLKSPLFTNLPVGQAVSEMQGGTVSTVPAFKPPQRAMEQAQEQTGPRFASIGSGENKGPDLDKWLKDALAQIPGKGRTAVAARAGLMEKFAQLKEGTYNSGEDRNLKGQELEQTGALGQARLTTEERMSAERNRASLDAENTRGQWSMAQQGLQNAGAFDRAQVQADQRGIASEMSGLYRILNNAEAPEVDRLQAERRLQELQYGAPEQELAEGGLVYGMDDYQSAVGYAQGGVVQGYGQAPSAAQALPQVNEYRDYAMGAKALGLPAIPFEQFITLRQGAQQVAQAPGPVQPMTAMGFANGGMVPDMHDVSGKMVVDTDPNAPTDSIPAVVDGQMPAKLDSGEFVIPTDVVKFFGTDKLNKMIAQARQGQQAAGE